VYKIYHNHNSIWSIHKYFLQIIFIKKTSKPNNTAKEHKIPE